MPGIPCGAARGRPPTGSACGDLTGSYPCPELRAIGSATGPLGGATRSAIVTVDAKGRVSSLSSVLIQIADTQVTGLTASLSTLSSSIVTLSSSSATALTNLSSSMATEISNVSATASAAIPKSIATAANQMLYSTGASAWASASLLSGWRSLLGSTKAAWNETTGKLGIGASVAPVYDVDVVYSTAASLDTQLPSISVQNDHVSTATSDYSFASFRMQGKNNSAVPTMVGQFFADGSGHFLGNPLLASLYFRTFNAHPIVFGTAFTPRMIIGRTGTVAIGSTGWVAGAGWEAKALLQVGDRNATFHTGGTDARLAVHGAAIQSQTAEVLVRLVRNLDAANYYPAVVDLRVSAWQAGGPGNGYNPATKLEFNLKSATSYAESADVTVMDLRSDGTVRIPALTAGNQVYATTGGRLTTTEPSGSAQKSYARIFMMMGA